MCVYVVGSGARYVSPGGQGIQRGLGDLAWVLGPACTVGAGSVSPGGAQVV